MPNPPGRPRGSTTHGERRMYSWRLPVALVKAVRERAKRDGVSANALVLEALAWRVGWRRDVRDNP